MKPSITEVAIQFSVEWRDDDKPDVVHGYFLHNPFVVNEDQLPPWLAKRLRSLALRATRDSIPPPK